MANEMLTTAEKLFFFLSCCFVCRNQKTIKSKCDRFGCVGCRCKAAKYIRVVYMRALCIVSYYPATKPFVIAVNLSLAVFVCARIHQAHGKASQSERQKFTCAHCANGRHRHHHNNNNRKSGYNKLTL